MDYRQAIRDSERANGYHVVQSGSWAARRSGTPRNPMRGTRLTRHVSMPTATVQQSVQTAVVAAAATNSAAHGTAHYPTTEEDSDRGSEDDAQENDDFGQDLGHGNGEETDDDGADDATMRVLQLESELAVTRLALARAERELLRRDQAAARARREEADLQLASGEYWRTNKRRV